MEQHTTVTFTLSILPSFSFSETPGGTTIVAVADEPKLPKNNSLEIQVRPFVRHRFLILHTFMPPTRVGFIKLVGTFWATGHNTLSLKEIFFMAGSGTPEDDCFIPVDA